MEFVSHAFGVKCQLRTGGDAVGEPSASEYGLITPSLWLDSPGLLRIGSPFPRFCRMSQTTHKCTCMRRKIAHKVMQIKLVPTV